MPNTTNSIPYGMN